MRHPLVILCAILIGLPAPAPAEDIIRQQKQVQIGKISETWQLVWHGKPEALCPASDMESSMTCPCAGFACRAGGKPPLRLNSRPWRSDY